jgi:peptide/nickel transport system substrate-binding protein
LTLVFTVLFVLGMAYAPLARTGAGEDVPFVITVGTPLDPDGFNVFSMTTGISYAVIWMSHEMLYTIGPDMGPTPQLASSHSVSGDGRTWTFNIVQDSYWHDGVQVTAHDVAFTLNTILENPGPCGTFTGYMTNVTSVEATGDFTVQIVTEVPKATMLALTVPILPEHLWTAVADDNKLKTVDPWDPKYFPDGPIGSGPLVLDQWDKAQGFVRMSKWADYHLGEVNVDELLFKIFDRAENMPVALETGEIDIAMSVPPTQWAQLLSKENIDGQAVQALDLTEFGFNCASEELRTSTDGEGNRNFPDASTNLETTNLSVRTAVAMAVNKTKIVDEALQGFGVEGDSLIPTATPFWHYYVPPEEKIEYDLQAARDLLDAAGYIDIDDDGIRENSTSGAELSFDFYYISNTVRDELAASEIYEGCKAIGIDAEPIGRSEGILYSLWLGMEYDMFIWNWQPDVDPTFLLGVLTTDEIPADEGDNAAWSDCFYSNPVYDNLHLQQQQTVNLTERQAIVHEMQRIVYLDVPYIILWYPDGLNAYRTDTLMNIPDFGQYPGSTPDSFWFYLEVLPFDATANLPPTDVNAGPDRTVVLGAEETFSGSAYDPDHEDEELNWTWEFEEPDLSSNTLYGRTVSYTFNNLGSVTATLIVTDPEGASGSDVLMVTVEEVPEDAGWLSGYVKDDQGEPIEGATVTVDEDTVPQTSSSGYYNVTVSAGTHEVNASAIGYSSSIKTAVVEISNRTWLNFTLSSTSGALNGTVTDADTGEGISHAKVVLAQDGVTRYTKYTGDDGYFKITGIPAGIYTVSITAGGYEENVTDVEVTVGSTTTLDVSLAVKEVDDSAISTLVLAAIIIAAILAAVAVVAMMLRKKRGSSPEGDETEPQPPNDLS